MLKREIATRRVASRSLPPAEVDQKPWDFADKWFMNVKNLKIPSFL